DIRRSGCANDGRRVENRHLQAYPARDVEADAQRGVTMNRRNFLRSLIAGAGAVVAARVLPALATENPIFTGQIGTIDGMVIHRCSTNLAALTAAQKKLWSRDLLAAAREQCRIGTFANPIGEKTNDQADSRQEGVASQPRR